MRARVQDGRAFALDQVRSLVDSLMAQSSLPSSIDSELTARAALAAAEHAAGLLVRDPVTYTAERLANFAEQLVNALRNQHDITTDPPSRRRPAARGGNP